MSYLSVTFIDVGWGDSILLEASDPASPRPRFALIDSNDNAEKSYWPTWNFLRKQFGLRRAEFAVEKPFFDFVMLTHDHSDHGTGLKRIMQEYGARRFWYPKVKEEESVIVTSLHAYANRAQPPILHQAVDSNYIPGCLGEAAMDFLWPPPDTIDANPNNNSVVLALSLNGQTVVLTGDAEGEVWEQIAAQIPADTCVFKVPHHGSRNGTLFHQGAPWLEKLDSFAVPPHLALSCHPTFPSRFGFPHPEVMAKFAERPYPTYETDLHYHITFTIDGPSLSVKYSH